MERRAIIQKVEPPEVFKQYQARFDKAWNRGWAAWQRRKAVKQYVTIEYIRMERETFLFLSELRALGEEEPEEIDESNSITVTPEHYTGRIAEWVNVPKEYSPGATSPESLAKNLVRFIGWLTVRGDAVDELLSNWYMAEIHFHPVTALPELREPPAPTKKTLFVVRIEPQICEDNYFGSYGWYWRMRVGVGRWEKDDAVT
jgi:hypothetical protein